MRSIVFAFAIAGVAACGGGKGGGPGGGPGQTGAVSLAQAEPPCRDACEQFVACGSGDSVETCTNECVAFAAGWMRADALELFAACQASQPCGEDRDCERRVLPLAIHASYEAECRAALASCESDLEGRCEVDPPPEAIETFLRFVAPEIVEDLIACFSAGSDCATMSTCVEDTLQSVGFPL